VFGSRPSEDSEDLRGNDARGRRGGAEKTAGDIRKWSEPATLRKGAIERNRHHETIGYESTSLKEEKKPSMNDSAGNQIKIKAARKKKSRGKSRRANPCELNAQEKWGKSERGFV